MPKTSIEWTDYSWPVVNGCRRKSAGCGTGRAGGCYAERLAATRLKHTERYRGLAVMTDHGPQWTGETRLIEKELLMPLRLRTPSRIFVADMGDLFYEGVPFSVIDRVFAVMAMSPQHRFQILTKRADRMRAYLTDTIPSAWYRTAERELERELGATTSTARRLKLERALERALLAVRDGVLPNVDIGVSVEDQKTADERIPELLRTPGGRRWVSYEPALGPIDFDDERDYLNPRTCAPVDRLTGEIDFSRKTRGAGVDLVVVGGESGPRARPFDLAWARATIEQCRGAGVPVFCKQLGAHPIEHGVPLKLRSRKGNDMSEWDEDLRVRELPEAHHAG